MVEAYAKTAGKFTLWFQMFKLAAMLKTNAGQKRKLRGSQNQQRSTQSWDDFSHQLDPHYSRKSASYIQGVFFSLGLPLKSMENLG